ncbi:MAG: substrate-binding domain-containing protein [Rhodocyclaceae bacterium]
MKVNLKMLSESLGLSQTTVSRALNGYSDVAASTRERVAEAARRLGYQPDPLARRLATGRTDTVGLVFPFAATEFGDHRFGEVVDGLTDGLAQHGMDLSIIPTRPGKELDTYRRLIDTRRVDALIVGWTQVEDARIRLLQQARFPFLAYGRTHSTAPYPWFDFDNQAGARAAVERLIGLGHRCIGVIHAPLELNFARQRFDGYLGALAAAGIARDDSVIAASPLSRIAGYEAMLALLALPKPPTAVLVDNNLAGIGALRALGDKGIKPGRDLSVIVYDGVFADVPLPYSVSAVIQPTGERSGRCMAGMIVDVLAGKPVAELQHLAQPCLEAGDTDGPPPSA